MNSHEQDTQSIALHNIIHVHRNITILSIRPQQIFTKVHTRIVSKYAYQLTIIWYTTEALNTE